MEKQASNIAGEIDVTAPATEAAKLWDGWGTALKPAWEPIIVAMKPLDGTYAENALRHGVAGLNIGGTRIGTSGGTKRRSQEKTMTPTGWTTGHEVISIAAGHWPANLVLQHDARCVCVDAEAQVDVYACVPGCPVRMLDDQAGLRVKRKS